MRGRSEGGLVIQLANMEVGGLITMQLPLFAFLSERKEEDY